MSRWHVPFAIGGNGLVLVRWLRRHEARATGVIGYALGVAPNLLAVWMLSAAAIGAVHVTDDALDPITPSKDFPGAHLLGNLLQWGTYLSLVLSVGSIMHGAGSWTWSRWGNSGYAVPGKNWSSAASSELLSGLAVTIVNKLFTGAGA